MIKFKFLLFLVLGISLLSAQSKTEQLVMRLSKEKFQYFNADQAEKLRPLLDDRMIFIHSNGMTETKEEMISNLKAGKWKLRGVDIKELNARIYKNNTAILIGKGTFLSTNASGVDADIELYFTEIYTHVKAGWLLAGRHALRLQ